MAELARPQRLSKPMLAMAGAVDAFVINYSKHTENKYQA